VSSGHQQDSGYCVGSGIGQLEENTTTMWTGRVAKQERVGSAATVV